MEQKKFKIAWLLPIREQYIFINMFGTHYLLIAIAIAIVTAFTMVQNISTKKHHSIVSSMGLNSDTEKTFIVQGINLHVFLLLLIGQLGRSFFYLLLA